jgi:RNA polymerase sigma-70 factor (ECF subfamily)
MSDAASSVADSGLDVSAPAGSCAEAPPADLDAFLASVERRAFRLAELALGQREDALDAVQDAMLKLLRYRDRPGAEWTPLFWSILRHQLTDRQRRSGIRQRLLTWFARDGERDADPLASVRDPGPDPLRSHVESERWSALGRALRRLPRRQRECFLLRELQGLSVAHTAQAMGCSEGSVKTHLSRALGALRAHLEDWR